MYRDKYILIFFVVIHLSAVQSNHVPEDNDCIDNYQELKQSLLDNSGSLLLAFYPPNESPTRVLNVFYYIEALNDTEPNMTADYIFQWVDSSTLLLTEFDLFKALSFGIAALTPNDVNVTIAPFCHDDEAIDLLNQGTTWLKSYSVGTDETDRFYAQYFDGKNFIVIGSNIRETTTSLLVFEYLGALGFATAIYVMLIFSALNFENIKYVGWFLSEISLPCLGLSIAILANNINYYNNSLQYTDSEWLRALPAPVIFPVFSVANLIIAIMVITFITIKEKKGEESFPLPSIIESMCFSHDHCPLLMRAIKRCIQVILLYSITLFVALLAFHFVWVTLAISAYPSRSIASLAFVFPFISISLIVFFFIEVIAMAFEYRWEVDHPNHENDKAHKVIEFIDGKLKMNFADHLRHRQGTKTSHSSNPKNKLKLIIVVIIIVLPLLVAVFGGLYFYSQALIDVNDAENNPFKTIIAAAIPSLLIGWFTYIVGKLFHTFISKKKPAEMNIVDITGKAMTELEKALNVTPMSPSFPCEDTSGEQALSTKQHQSSKEDEVALTITEN